MHYSPSLHFYIFKGTARLNFRPFCYQSRLDSALITLQIIGLKIKIANRNGIGVISCGGENITLHNHPFSIVDKTQSILNML